ncbi:MAG: hypothetical protein V4543_00875 [Bacteroidota bacterium]
MKQAKDLETLSNKDYWEATVGKVDRLIPNKPGAYIEKVEVLLRQKGVQVSKTTIENVRHGRVKGNRVVSKAIYEVGITYKTAVSV